AGGGRPGGVGGGVPAFFDFLVGESNPARQALYRDGLGKVNRDAQSEYGKPFAGLSGGEGDSLLPPLKAARAYKAPADRSANFLREAKNDIVQATFNSREFAQAGARGRRGAQATGSYWLPLD